MISVVIRNKNEAEALESTLKILNGVYAEDIDEIIVVDNKSTDQSIAVARKFNCKIITIEKFTYGKAINFGIENAKNELVLLLSSHAIPVGQSFFKESKKEFIADTKLAGIRYVNSHSNYLRAFENNFFVHDGLSFGLMAACAMINKKIWLEHKFNESIVASEDKEWSERVLADGYSIRDLNETYFYYIKRNDRSNLNRLKNETIAHYQLHHLVYPSFLKIILIFVKRIILDIPKDTFKSLIKEVKILFIKLKIRSNLQNK